MPSTGAGATRFGGLASLQATRLKHLQEQSSLSGDGAVADSEEDERQQHSTGPGQQADHHRTLQRLAGRDRDSYSDGKEQKVSQGGVPVWPRQHYLHRSLLLQQLHPARTALLQHQQWTKQVPDPANASSHAPGGDSGQQLQGQGQQRTAQLPWPRLAKRGHEACRAIDRQDRREAAGKLGLVNASGDAVDPEDYGLSEPEGDLSRLGEGYRLGCAGGGDDSSALGSEGVSRQDQDMERKYMVGRAFLLQLSCCKLRCRTRWPFRAVHLRGSSASAGVGATMRGRMCTHRPLGS